MNKNASKHSVLWLSQGNDTLPSSRFRVWAMCKVAKRHFAEASICKRPKDLIKRLMLYLGLKNADICIIQKSLLPLFECRMLKSKCKLLVYDFDDALWIKHSLSTDASDETLEKRFRRICSAVDFVVAGNEYLASFIPAGTPYHVMNTPIDTQYYEPAQNIPDLTIGWMGTASYLNWLRPVLEELAPLSIPMQVVSNKAPEFDLPGNSIFLKWSSDDELKQLQGFSIGLMPLEDTAYARGKSGFKILQYMACGVVPIASAVGLNTEIIEHGKNGYLVNEMEDWSRYVNMLRDPELRGKMSVAARARAVDKYDLGQASEVMFSRLEECLAR